MSLSRTNSQEARVQFVAEQINDGHNNSEIQVKVTNQFVVNVHLGFLKIHHRYQIKFHFECPEPMDQLFNLETHSTPNAKIVQLERENIDDPLASSTMAATPPFQHYRHLVIAHLCAYKEKFLKEQIFLQCDDNSFKSLMFVFSARVLGEEKGTPLLKDGIKCIGFEPVLIDEIMEEKHDTDTDLEENQI